MARMRNYDLVEQLPTIHRIVARVDRLCPHFRGRHLCMQCLWRSAMYLYRSTGRVPEHVLNLDGRFLVIDLLDGRLPLVLAENSAGNFAMQVLLELLSEGDTFIDVGANHGSYSALAASVVGPRGHVAAFEVQPRLLGLLRQTVNINHFEQIQMFDIACSDNSEMACFYVPVAGSGEGGLHVKFSGRSRHQTLQVRTAKLDDVVAKELPGNVIVKVDTEGHELRVLKGAERTLQDYEPIVMIEMHPATAQAAGGSVEQVVAQLGRYGYGYALEQECRGTIQCLDKLALSHARNIFVCTPAHLHRLERLIKKSAEQVGRESSVIASSFCKL